MRLFFFSLLSFPLLVYAQVVCPHKLSNKLRHPPPSWMLEQIEEDLSGFQGVRVTRNMLDQTMEEVYQLPTGQGAQFVRYKIQNNKIYFETPSENPTDVRIVDFVKFIELLASYVDLPDVEFIASLWDSYDRPIFLEKTYCPIFTMCRLKTNRKGVLFPEVRFFEGRKRIFEDIEKTSLAVSWRKKQGKAFWRGGTTGGYYPLYEWDFKPRPRLVLFSKDHPELIDAYFTYPYWIDNAVKMIFEDYHFFTSWAGQSDWLAYKYLIAVDGNTFPSSFWWELLSNCTVIKGDSEYIEWFYKGVQPFVHYIPYNQDCSDLEERLHWLLSHDAEARKIAENGTQFAKEHLAIEDMMLYFYLLFNAYAQLQ